MAYPPELLVEGEQVIIEFKPHWSALWQEALYTIAYVLLLILLAPGGYNGWVFLIITGLWLWFALRGFLTWQSTDHVLTNERFIYRAGMFRKVGYEIPLEEINDVAFRQNAFERVLHVGDLMVQTSSVYGQSRLANIPEPENIKMLIMERRRARRQQTSTGGHVSAPSTSNAEQLAILGRLLDEGKLSPEEYQAEKARLLG